MPWLALPFKDSNHKKLTRILGYPNDLNGSERPPTLVIFGPNGGFVDPCGGDILMDFEAPACPFTRKRLDMPNLRLKKIKELKLEMLWNPNTVFRAEKDGLEFLPNFYPLLELMIPNSKIPFSQFAGKRVLIVFEMFTSCFLA